MKHETRYFRVTTRHPTGWQDGVHEFRVSTTHASNDDGSGTMPLAWYAVAPKFGCSKNYMSPTLAIRAMCTDHACEVVNLVEYDPETEAQMARATEIAKRMTVEKRIVSRAVRDLIAAGYSLAWYDVGNNVPHQDHALLMNDYAACDEMVLNVHWARDGERTGWVQFVYGNDDGSTVICDYTVKLEPALAGAEALADKLAG